MPPILETKIQYLPGVGEARAKVLAKEINVHTYGDMVYYFPYKHVDRTRFYKTTELEEDLPFVQLKGVITSFRVVGTGRKQRLVARFKDSYGEINLIWFHRISYFYTQYKVNTPYLILGRPSRLGSIVHPEIEDLEKAEAFVGNLYPIYSTTNGMKRSGLTSKVIAELQVKLLEILSRHLSESLPDYIVQHYKMLSLYDSLKAVHRPSNGEELKRGTLRLKAEEILSVRLRLRYLKSLRDDSLRGFVMKGVGDLFHRFYREVLPFSLTGAQQRVIREIFEDMKSGRQMNRLLQGDVGSGKTIVALISMLVVVDNGYQACMMAPTEILARQHYETLSALLAPLEVRVELLTGSTSAREKKRLGEALKGGEVKILVGTHALIQDYVQFKNLGLAIIDEQHRFGVHQRAIMWDKSSSLSPHILIMSATPIPRTLAMTLYGDLDVSVIDELPPGRTPIQTRHYYESDRVKVYSFLADQIREGRQVYVVYPLIEESQKLDYKSLEEGVEQLRESFPHHQIGLVHGKLKPKEKEEVMSLFATGKLSILVATTVIEVGVNVPNASLMLIESAERFGLSQLHQLRGRVGRGALKSYCILMTGGGLSQDSRRRMEIMTETTNGFKIAEEDLRLRGHGDMEGTRQSGVGESFKIANLAKDGRVVQFCVNLVEEILSLDPRLQDPRNARLLEMVRRDGSTPVRDWGVIS